MLSGDDLPELCTSIAMCAEPTTIYQSYSVASKFIMMHMLLDTTSKA